MKTFKKIDFWVQIFSIAFFAVLSLIRQDDTFFIGYFVVGGLQVISMIIHRLNNWFTNKGSNRYYYQFFTLAVVVSMIMAPIIPLVFFIYLIMLYLAPLMAIYYTTVCFKEIAVLEAKAFIHLK